MRRMLLLSVVLPWMCGCASKPSSTPAAPAAPEPSKPSAAAPASLAELIVGMWRLPKNSKQQASLREFLPPEALEHQPLSFKDGRLSMVNPGPTFTSMAEYKILDHETIEVWMIHLGFENDKAIEKKTAAKFKVKVAGDHLTVADTKGHSDRYERIKESDLPPPPPPPKDEPPMPPPGATKPSELIIGRWLRVDGPKKASPWCEDMLKEAKTFAINIDGAGSFKLRPEGSRFWTLGWYKFVGDDIVEHSHAFGDPAKVPTYKLKVKVTQNEMTLTDDKGNSDRFSRVK